MICLLVCFIGSTVCRPAVTAVVIHVICICGMQWWDTLIFHVGFLNGQNSVTDVELHCCVLAATDVALPTAVWLYVERCSQYLLLLRLL